jgi:hypothetical protein
MEFCACLHLIRNLTNYLMKSKNYSCIMVTMKMMITALVITISTQLHAQHVYVVSGTVTTAEDKQPLPGANIYLKSLSSVGTFSDSKGEFEFPRLLQKGDTLVFSFLGLKTTEYGVPDQPVTSLVIEMEADLIQMVDEILVEGDESSRVALLPKRVRKQKNNR